MRPDKKPAIFLVDNGSLRPAATWSLRTLAANVTQAAGVRVEPVSLLHSHKVDPAKLGDQPAEILEPAIQSRAQQGVRHFLILPLFFGPSKALTDYIPKVVARLAVDFPSLSIRIAPSLIYDEDDYRLCAEMLGEFILDTAERKRLRKPKVTLVDHGSPVQAVTAVRNKLAQMLENNLAGEMECVRPSSMERRPEPDYAFNEPLLENLLREPDFATGEIIVSMLFLQPGRHAGPGGDVQTICKEAAGNPAHFRTHVTPLIGQHPKLIHLLKRRLEAALA